MIIIRLIIKHASFSIRDYRVRQKTLKTFEFDYY